MTFFLKIVLAFLQYGMHFSGHLLQYFTSASPLIIEIFYDTLFQCIKKFSTVSAIFAFLICR